MELRQPAGVGPDGRYHDCGHLGFAAPQLPQHVPAGAVGQIDIQQDQVGPLMRHRTDRRLGSPSFADQQPAAAEVDRDDAAQCGLVLDDQHTPVRCTWRFDCGAVV